MSGAEIFSAGVLLLLVIDPFGNVPLVMAALPGVDAAQRRRIVLRECVIAYVILLAFMLGGRTFLQWMQLSEESLAIAGRHHPVPDRAAHGVPPPGRPVRRHAPATSRSSCRWRCPRSPGRRRSPR